jgi:hypothetical protein
VRGYTRLLLRLLRGGAAGHRARLNRPGDLVLCSDSDEDKDAAAVESGSVTGRRRLTGRPTCQWQ